ncbi:MAG: hypothetical protein RL115_363 [Bacteroidota bacterium]|jgi:hypothetical protein
MRILIFVLFVSVNAVAQVSNLPFKKKDQFISIQHGFPNTIKNSLETIFGFNQTNKKSVGPISIAYEYHVNELMSVGASISYATYSADYKDVFGVNVAFKGTLHNTALLLQSTRYLESDNKALLYGKGSIGINLWSGEYRRPDGTDFKNFNAPSPIGYNAVVGVKYRFSKKSFGYLEAGYGKYIVAAGLSLQVNKK